jgi:hypothetical protein
MVTTIISLLIQYLPLILQSAGVISPAIETLIQQLGAALPGLIASLVAGKGPTQDVLTILQAFQTELATLRTNTALSPVVLAMADELDRGITAALNAYVAAEKTTDPTTLTELPTNL